MSQFTVEVTSSDLLGGGLPVGLHDIQIVGAASRVQDAGKGPYLQIKFAMRVMTGELKGTIGSETFVVIPGKDSYRMVKFLAVTFKKKIKADLGNDAVIKQFIGSKYTYEIKAKGSEDKYHKTVWVKFHGNTPVAEKDKVEVEIKEKTKEDYEKYNKPKSSDNGFNSPDDGFGGSTDKDKLPF